MQRYILLYSLPKISCSLLTSPRSLFFLFFFIISMAVQYCSFMTRGKEHWLRHTTWMNIKLDWRRSTPNQLYYHGKVVPFVRSLFLFLLSFFLSFPLFSFPFLFPLYFSFLFLFFFYPLLFFYFFGNQFIAY